MEQRKKHFEDWIEEARRKNVRARIAVAAANDLHTLQSVAEAEKTGLVSPILIGPKEKIRELLKEIGRDADAWQIEDIEDPHDCAVYAAGLARDGRADCIMKGKIETGEIMKVIVNKESGLRTDRVMSLLGFYESPYYHKIFSVTDMGLLTYPDVQQKANAIRNAVHAWNRLGVETPKVAVLTAVERVNPKMPECLEADELKRMNREGKLEGCIVEGPISYDLAMDPEAAAAKGYESPVAGDADLLVVPNITCGNILVKALTCTGGARTCGVILGAKVPLVVTSRSATAFDKYMSIVLASLIGKG